MFKFPGTFTAYIFSSANIIIVFNSDDRDIPFAAAACSHVMTGLSKLYAVKEFNGVSL